MTAHINVTLADDLDVRTATEQVTILADGTEVTFEGTDAQLQRLGRAVHAAVCTDGGPPIEPVEGQHLIDDALSQRIYDALADAKASHVPVEVEDWQEFGRQAGVAS